MKTYTAASGEEAQTGAGPTPALSDREQEVLALVAEGLTDREIAGRLYLSADTVAWYVKQIRTQLDARSRAHAVALAIGYGILSLDWFPGEHK